MVCPKNIKPKSSTLIATAIFVSISIVISSNSLFTSSLNNILSYVTPSKLTLPGEKKYKIKDDIPIGELAEYKCIGAAENETEDIFCLQRPTTLSNYKNPCWKDGNNTVRCLPYFHLGTSKCGSSDLFYRIKQHPEVSTCSRCVADKETWYWAWDRYGFAGKNKRRTLKSFSKYITYFDAAAKRIEKKTVNGYHTGVIGDGSPMTFWDLRGWTRIPQNKGLSEPRVLTPHLMRHMTRDMKMILILRDPVDRLYSDYYYYSFGESPESFHKDAVAAVKMMRSCLSKNSIAACFYSHDMYYKQPVRITIGCYAVFLKVWLSVFPRENFLFLRLEDYGVDPAKTLSDIFDFLKLRSLDADEIDSILKIKRRNVTKKKEKAPPMLNSTRVILSNFYAQYNTQLARMLKDDRFAWGLLGHEDVTFKVL